MSRSDVEYIEFPGFPTAVVRFREYPMHDMPAAMDRAFSALGRAIGEGAFTPTGPAFARHEVRPSDTATFEVGFPVDAPLPSNTTINGVEIVNSELPACATLATTKHHGPYDGLAASWQSFMEAIDADGKSPLLPFWEAYDTEPGPDVDPETLITGLATPVEDK
ncbi:GyrI-like domain-containing protein [Kocuria massiliensis]|uniref:GyrI-like domain-containing protein n=1 Tax=Kocuria massiliensis TaxID=1926282 RepID=UPI0022B9CC35|nr:GyrI-like domain-containing protein [Kocuria massiliensis]